MNWLQTALDVVGLVPVVGEPADAINAAIYTARGDYANAALSAAAVVPVAGIAATATKFATKYSGDALSVARTLGRAGESAAGITKNTERIESLTGTAKFRIPDELSNKVLREVKNVEEQALTHQIRDFLLHAEQQGLKFDLVVRKNTQVTRPLQELIDQGRINLQRVLD